LSAVVLLAAPALADACTDTWTGTAGDGLWSTAANWSTDAVPGSSDEACLPDGASVTLNSGSYDVGSVDGSDASLSLTGGSLSIDDTSTVSHIGDFYLNGATLSGAGELDVADSFDDDGGGELSGSGSLVLEADSSNTINAGGYFELDGYTLENEGTSTVTYGGIYLDDGAAIINASGATLNIDTYDTVMEAGGGAAPSLVNYGTIASDAGSGETAYLDVWTDNEGTISSTSGWLALGDGGTSGLVSDGTWSTSGDGSVVDLSGGSFTFYGETDMSGGSFAGGSGVVIEGASVAADDIQGSGAALWFAAGSLSLSGPTVSHIGDFYMNSYATLSGAGELDVADSFDDPGGGVLSGSGSLVLGPGSSNTINPGGWLPMYGYTLVNEGTTTITYAGIYAYDSAVFENAPGATLDIASGYTVMSVLDSSSPLFINYGAIIEDDGGSTSTVTWPFANEGTIDQESGTIDFTGPKVTLAPVPGEQNGGSNAGELGDKGCKAADPVDCASGNLFETQTDLSVAGLGGGMALTRTYNSQAAAAATAPGIFGYGWTASYTDSLVINSVAGTATVVQANGSTTPFTINSGSFTAPAWVQATLVQNEDGSYTYTLPDGDTENFNSSGVLTSEADANGNTTSLSYNDAGQLTTITDAAGQQITLTYNDAGLVASATDPSGLTVYYTYDGSDNLTGVSDSSGLSTYRWEFGYDGSHQMTSMTDADGNTTTSEYDSSNRVVSQTDPLDQTTTWSYSGDPLTGASTTEITNPGGDVTREVFDYGVPTEVTRAYGTSAATTEDISYNAAFEPTSKTDGDGHTTTYTYDSAGNQTSATDPDGNETEWTYNSLHEPLTETSPEDQTTTMTYDDNGNLTSSSRTLVGSPDHTATTSYTYYSDGQLESETDPDGNETTYTYDSDGNLTSVTDPDGNETTYTYDSDGRETSVTSPRGNVEDADAADFTTTYALDALGRVSAVTDPLGHETTYSYDAAGNVTSVTDPNGNTTTTTYNGDGEVTKITYPDSSTQQSTYTADGQLASQTNQNGKTTSYSYDAAGNLVSETDPLDRTTSYTYDAAGNVTSKTDPEDRTTSYTYNDDNELTGVSYSDDSTPNVTYSYNDDGQLTAMDDGTGDSSYSYDSLGRLTSTTDGHGDTIGYGYDLDGNETSITYPNDETVTRTFDDDGNLASVSDWLGNTTSFTYDPDRNLTETSFAGDADQSDAYTYNDADELTGTTISANDSTLASLDDSYDDDGNLTEESSTGLDDSTREYTYNDLDELTADNSADDAYDPDGNLTELDGGSTQSYNDADELTSGPGGTYTYNDLGERTAQTDDDTTTDYGWNQAGNLTTNTGGSSDLDLSYGYDGNGLLQSTTTGDTTTQLTWDPNNSIPLLIVDGTTNIIYGPGDLPLEQIGSDDTPIYYHHDQLGSTRLLTNTDGDTVETINYSPYGTPTISSGSATTNLLYAGQYTDPNNALIYMQARWYDPASGQFLSVDPLAAETGATYSYAGDDPTGATDPTGLDSWCGVLIPGGPVGSGCPPPPPIPNPFPALGQGLRDLGNLESQGLTDLWSGVKSLFSSGSSSNSDECALTGANGPEGAVGPSGEPEGSVGTSGQPSGSPNFDDPAQSPGEGWEWRGNGPGGSSQGSWYNPTTDESLHPDLDHPGPIGPHYDYTAPDGATYRIYPNGTMAPK
jgi:RHS repeat-associated protein